MQIGVAVVKIRDKAVGRSSRHVEGLEYRSASSRAKLNTVWGAATSEAELIKASGRNVDPNGTFLQLALAHWSAVQPRTRASKPCGNMEPGGILSGRGGKFGIILDWIEWIQ